MHVKCVSINNHISLALKKHVTSQIVILHFFIFICAICKYDIAYISLNIISFVEYAI